MLKLGEMWGRAPQRRTVGSPRAALRTCEQEGSPGGQPLELMCVIVVISNEELSLYHLSV